MPAPKGNKYALGNKGNTETKYKPEFCQDLIEYFDRPAYIYLTKTNQKTGEETPVLNKFGQPIKIEADFPTVEGWCSKQRIDKTTFYAWVNKYQEFSNANMIAKQCQANILQQNGLNRNYDARFATLMAVNLMGMTTDKQQVESKTTITHQVGDGHNVKLLAEHKKLKEKYETDLKKALLDSQPIEGEIVE